MTSQPFSLTHQELSLAVANHTLPGTVKRSFKRMLYEHTEDRSWEERFGTKKTDVFRKSQSSCLISMNNFINKKKL